MQIAEQTKSKSQDYLTQKKGIVHKPPGVVEPHIALRMLPKFVM